MRSAGTVLLNATDLQNQNSDSNGFTVGTMTGILNFGMIINTAAASNTTFYLYPGVYFGSSAGILATDYPIYFPKTSIVYGGSANYSGTNLGGAHIFTISFKKNGTAFATLTISSGSTIVNFTNASATFTTSDYFSVSALLSNDGSLNATFSLNVMAMVY